MFPPIEELQALRGAPVAIPSTVIKAKGTAPLTMITGSFDQIEIEISITADFTQLGVNAGVSVMGGVPVTLMSLPKVRSTSTSGLTILSRICQLYTAPPCALWCMPYLVPMPSRVLIGACNLMLCPIHVVRARTQRASIS